MTEVQAPACSSAMDVERSLLFYPGRGLSAQERERVDTLSIPLEDLTPDHIVYSLGRYVETSFANFYAVAADLVGPEMARQIAFEAGHRHGGGGYAWLLAAHQTPGAGNPRLMAMFQDIAHALRGPKHSLCLFATVDDRQCVVKKPACGYFEEQRPEAAPYVGAFEAGCFEGYRAADRNLESVEVVRCCWRLDGECEVRFTWKAPAPVTGQAD